MRNLWLALVLLILGFAPAQAQTQCLVPINAAATPIVSTAIESSHVLSTRPGCLISTYMVSGASSGFFLVFNAITAPVDGAVAPIECVPVAANSYQFINFAPQPPEFYSTGVVVVFSTGANCLTKTASATAWFHGIVQ